MANPAARAFLAVSLGMLIGACEQDTQQRVDGPPRDMSAVADAGDAADVADAAGEGALAPCQNGERDGDETDVDCGGSCSPCLLGKVCIENSDCGAGECIEGVCAFVGPTCDNFTACDDGDMCNGISTCVEGRCQQTTAPVTCAAQDACHLVGTCDPQTGECSNPSKDCDDGDAETADLCELPSGNCLNVIPFVDNGDGTVSDITTNLVWQQTPNSDGMPVCDAMMDYSQCPAEDKLAAAHCESNADGLPGTGWRLPTISELRSLVKGCEASYWNPVTKTGGACQVTDDCLNYWACQANCGGCDYRTGPGEDGYFIDPIFATSGHGWFWASSPSVMYIDRGWSIAFYNGLLNNNYIFSKFGVRCVREGP